MPLPALTFWVGPAPVIVTTEVVPTARADVKLSLTAAEVTAEAQTTTELSAGVKGKLRDAPECSADW